MSLCWQDRWYKRALLKWDAFILQQGWIFSQHVQFFNIDETDVRSPVARTTAILAVPSEMLCLYADASFLLKKP